MIPFFQWIHIPIGPVNINVWGLMVALGMLAGLLVAAWHGKQRGLHTQHIFDMGFWIMFASIIGSRLIYVLSEMQLYINAPLDTLKIWQGGMSISGGFLAAAIAFWLYIRHTRLPFLAYADCYIFGLPVGLWIGRLGCFFIFDHPGTPTNFFLGQVYVDGIVRHNHGLYLSLNGLLLTLLFFFLWKRHAQRVPGFFLTLFLICYGVVRFSLDFFRAYDLPVTDTRFAGVTVAQYVALLMVAGGLVLWYAMIRKQVYTHATRTTKTIHPTQETSDEQEEDEEE